MAGDIAGTLSLDLAPFLSALGTAKSAAAASAADLSSTLTVKLAIDVDTSALTTAGAASSQLAAATQSASDAVTSFAGAQQTASSATTVATTATTTATAAQQQNTVAIAETIQQLQQQVAALQEQSGKQGEVIQRLQAHKAATSEVRGELHDLQVETLHLASDALPQLSGNLTTVNSVIGAASKALRAAGDEEKSFAETAGIMGAALTAAGIGAASGFFAVFDSGLTTLHLTAEQFGMTIPQVQGLNTALAEVGLPAGSATMSMRMVAMQAEQMQQKINDGLTVNTRFSKGMDEIGVSALDLAGNVKPMGDLLPEIFAGFQRTAQQAEAAGGHFNAAGVAAELFGRRGAQMVPALLQGRQAMDDATVSATKLGIGSAEQVANLEKLHESTAAATLALQGMAMHIGSDVSPVMVAVAQAAGNAADFMAKLPFPLRDLIVLGPLLAGGLGLATFALGELITSARTVIGFVPTVTGALQGLVGVNTAVAASSTAAAAGVVEFEAVTGALAPAATAATAAEDALAASEVAVGEAATLGLGPIGLAIAAAVALGAAVAELASRQQLAQSSWFGLADSYKTGATSAQQAIDQLTHGQKSLTDQGTALQQDLSETITKYNNLNDAQHHLVAASGGITALSEKQKQEFRDLSTAIAATKAEYDKYSAAAEVNRAAQDANALAAQKEADKHRQNAKATDDDATAHKQHATAMFGDGAAVENTGRAIDQIIQKYQVAGVGVLQTAAAHKDLIAALKQGQEGFEQHNAVLADYFSALNVVSLSTDEFKKRENDLKEGLKGADDTQKAAIQTQIQMDNAVRELGAGYVQAVLEMDKYGESLGLIGGRAMATADAHQQLDSMVQSASKHADTASAFQQQLAQAIAHAGDSADAAQARHDRLQLVIDTQSGAAKSSAEQQQKLDEVVKTLGADAATAYVHHQELADALGVTKDNAIPAAQKLSDLNQLLSDTATDADAAGQALKNFLTPPSTQELAAKAAVDQTKASIAALNAELANAGPWATYIANLQKVYDESVNTGKSADDQQKAQDALNRAVADAPPAIANMATATQKSIDALDLQEKAQSANVTALSSRREAMASTAAAETAAASTTSATTDQQAAAYNLLQQKVGGALDATASTVVEKSGEAARGGVTATTAAVGAGQPQLNAAYGTAGTASGDSYANATVAEMQQRAGDTAAAGHDTAATLQSQSASAFAAAGTDHADAYVRAFVAELRQRASDVAAAGHDTAAVLLNQEADYAAAGQTAGGAFSSAVKSALGAVVGAKLAAPPPIPTAPPPPGPSKDDATTPIKDATQALRDENAVQMAGIDLQKKSAELDKTTHDTKQQYTAGDIASLSAETEANRGLAQSALASTQTALAQWRAVEAGVDATSGKSRKYTQAEISEAQARYQSAKQFLDLYAGDFSTALSKQQSAETAFAAQQKAETQAIATAQRDLTRDIRTGGDAWAEYAADVSKFGPATFANLAASGRQYAATLNTQLTGMVTAWKDTHTKIQLDDLKLTQNLSADERTRVEDDRKGLQETEADQADAIKRQVALLESLKTAQHNLLTDAKSATDEYTKLQTSLDAGWSDLVVRAGTAAQGIVTAMTSASQAAVVDWQQKNDTLIAIDQQLTTDLEPEVRKRLENERQAAADDVAAAADAATQKIAEEQRYVNAVKAADDQIRTDRGTVFDTELQLAKLSNDTSVLATQEKQRGLATWLQTEISVVDAITALENQLKVTTDDAEIAKLQARIDADKGWLADVQQTIHEIEALSQAAADAITKQADAAKSAAKASGAAENKQASAEAKQASQEQKQAAQEAQQAEQAQKQAAQEAQRASQAAAQAAAQATQAMAQEADAEVSAISSAAQALISLQGEISTAQSTLHGAGVTELRDLANLEMQYANATSEAQRKRIQYAMEADKLEVSLAQAAEKQQEQILQAQTDAQRASLNSIKSAYQEFLALFQEPSKEELPLQVQLDKITIQIDQINEAGGKSRLLAGLEKQQTTLRDKLSAYADERKATEDLANAQADLQGGTNKSITTLRQDVTQLASMRLASDQATRSLASMDATQAAAKLSAAQLGAGTDELTGQIKQLIQQLLDASDKADALDASSKALSVSTQNQTAATSSATAATDAFTSSQGEATSASDSLGAATDNTTASAGQLDTNVKGLTSDLNNLTTATLDAASAQDQLSAAMGGGGGVPENLPNQNVGGPSIGNMSGPGLLQLQQQQAAGAFNPSDLIHIPASTPPPPQHIGSQFDISSASTGNEQLPWNAFGQSGVGTPPAAPAGWHWEIDTDSVQRIYSNGVAGTGSQYIPPYETGGYVPADTIAQLHAGEVVIPADQAGALVSGTYTSGLQTDTTALQQLHTATTHTATGLQQLTTANHALTTQATSLHSGLQATTRATQQTTTATHAATPVIQQTTTVWAAAAPVMRSTSSSVATLSPVVQGATGALQHFTEQVTASAAAVTQGAQSTRIASSSPVGGGGGDATQNYINSLPLSDRLRVSAGYSKIIEQHTAFVFSHAGSGAFLGSYAAGVSADTGLPVSGLPGEGKAPGGIIGAFQHGTPSVPEDQLAYLHRYEAVIPASQNPFRSDGGGMSNGLFAPNGEAAPSIHYHGPIADIHDNQFGSDPEQTARLIGQEVSKRLQAHERQVGRRMMQHGLRS